ncbi:YjfB family protein [uncultured Clostridium sp.]|uniref:YjfB family protein n=1 Tax=uncultured Clostridium sp. TaxID=59620 RepID=UPI0025CD2E18|nr:YjfB family protein [uncultured Clostridium sp.]
MDIAALSMNMHQIQLENQVQLSVMKMTMDNSDVLSENIIDMVENMAVDTNVGTNLDVRV